MLWSWLNRQKYKQTLDRDLYKGRDPAKSGHLTMFKAVDG